MGTRVDTGEALEDVARLLDDVDHEGRRACDDAQRLALVEAGRGVLRRVEALVCTLVGEADRASSSNNAKGTPTTSWLAGSGGTTAGEAAGLVFTGRDLTTWPRLQQAALAGRIGLKQARAVAKVLQEMPATLTPEQRDHAEGALLQRARTLTPDKLIGMADEVLSAVAPETMPGDDERAAVLDARARRARGRRVLTFHADGDGSILVKGSLPEADASPFRKLIDAYVERDRRAFRDAVEVDKVDALRSMGQRRADALVALTADHARLLGQQRSLSTRAEERTPAPSTTPQSKAVASEPGVASPFGKTSSPGTPSPHGTPSPPGTGVPSRDTSSSDTRTAGALPPNTSSPHASTSRTTDFTSPQGAAADEPAGMRQPHVAGDRPRVVVVMREDALRERAERAGILDTGASVSPGDLRRLCCDADIIPVVLGSHSEILDVGRSVRLVTGPLRQALSLRDGGCAFPGCHVADARCEAHHIVPWWAGGRTCLRNLVLLCPHHHGAVEPPRFWTGPPPDRWRVRMDAHGRPEFLRPHRADPEQTPIAGETHGSAARLRSSEVS